MVDCITICNSACITCIWCILFSVWYELVIIVDCKPSDKSMLKHVCSVCFFGKAISFSLVSQDSRRILEKWIRASVAYVESRCRNIEKHIRMIYRDVWELTQFMRDEDSRILLASNIIVKINKSVDRVTGKKCTLDQENVETTVSAWKKIGKRRKYVADKLNIRITISRMIL